MPDVTHLVSVVTSTTIQLVFNLLQILLLVSSPIHHRYRPIQITDIWGNEGLSMLYKVLGSLEIQSFWRIGSWNRYRCPRWCHLGAYQLLCMSRLLWSSRESLGCRCCARLCRIVCIVRCLGIWRWRSVTFLRDRNVPSFLWLWHRTVHLISECFLLYVA